MTTSLHDRLADLAADAPTGGPMPDLWETGRRVARRRRVGTTLIVAVVVLALGALGTADWARSRPDPLPAAPHGGTRLPDRFYDPSRWLPTTSDDGPLGPLVAVLGSGGGGLVGVSASSGVYRRLDLPGWTWDDDPLGSSEIAVSADGRRVGYWYVADGRVLGVAAYDAVTNEVVRHDIPSEYGVMPEGMAWIGDRLWFSAPHYQDADGHSARGRTTTVWAPETDEARAVPLGRSPSFANETTMQGAVVEADRRGVGFYSPDEPPSSLRIKPSFSGPIVVSPHQYRLAVLLDPDPSSTDAAPHRVAVLSPASGARTIVRRVPGLRTNEVVAWRDEEHVIVRTGDSFASVDVDAGDGHMLTTTGPAWVPGLHVAADAWTAPTYHASPPPSPLDPRKVWGGGALVLLAGAGALLVWRRRARV